MSKLVKAFAGDWTRSCLIQALVVSAVVPLAGVCILLPLAVVSNASFDETTTLLIMLVPMIGFLVVILGGSLGGGVWLLARRARWLDAALNPLGLQGRMYLLSGRQYHGTVQGREAHVYFYRGPVVDIYLGTPLQTRFSAGEHSGLGRAIAGMVNRQPLALDYPDLAQVSVYGLDEAWLRELLSDARARDLIRRFALEPAPALIRQIHLQPGAFYLRFYRNQRLFQFEFTAEQARGWFGELLALARLAEALPAPQVTAQPTRLEQQLRGDRGKITLYAVLITCGLVAGLALCGLIPAAFAMLVALGN